MMRFYIRQTVSLFPGAIREIRFGVVLGITVGLFAHLMMCLFFWVLEQPSKDASGGSVTIQLNIGAFAFIILAVTQCFLSRKTRDQLRFVLANPVPRLLVYLSRIFALWIGLALVTSILGGAIIWFLDLSMISNSPLELSTWLHEELLTFFMKAVSLMGVLVAICWIPALFPWLTAGLFILYFGLGSDVSLFGRSYNFTEGWPLYSLGVLGYLLGSFGYRASSESASPKWKWIHSLTLFLQKKRGFIRIATVSILLCLCMHLVFTSEVSQRCTHETERFVYSFEPHDRTVIEPLFEMGDGIYEEVATLFSPPEDSGRIQVILTEVFDQTGVLGVANWKMVRMARTSFHPEMEKYGIGAVEVFRHELAHVFLEQISGGELRKFLKHVQVFHEGVAVYAQSNNPLEEMTRGQRNRMLRGVIKDSWWEVTFEHVLANSGGNRDKHDQLFPYEHGFIMALALTDAYGVDAAANLARYAGELEKSAIFYGTELFWRKLLSLGNYRYLLWRQAYEKRIKELKEEYKELLTAMPKPAIEVEWHDDEVWISQKSATDTTNQSKARFCIALPQVYTNKLEKEKEESDDKSGKSPPEDPITRTLKMVINSDDDGVVRVPHAQLETVDKDEIKVMAGWSHPDLGLPLLVKARSLRRNVGINRELTATMKTPRFRDLTGTTLGEKGISFKVNNTTAEPIWWKSFPAIRKKPGHGALPVFVSANSYNDADREYAWRAIDGGWTTRWRAKDKSMPQWLMLELDHPRQIKGVKITWDAPEEDYRRKIEVSPDGQTWKLAVDADFSSAQDRNLFDVTGVVIAAVDHNKLTILASNKTFGDTAPGVIKKLTVEYQVGDEKLKRVANENEKLEITAPAGQELRILRADYSPKDPATVPDTSLKVTQDEFEADHVKFIRVTCTGPGGNWQPGIWELKLLGPDFGWFLPKEKIVGNLGRIDSNKDSEQELLPGSACLLVNRKGEIIDAFIISEENNPYILQSTDCKQVYSFETNRNR